MVWLGGGYSSLGRFLDAETLIARAYEIDPLNTFVSGQFASLKAETGDTEGAIALFRRNISLEPDSPLPYSMLSQIYAATGRLDLAVPPLLQAIEKTPGSAQHLAGIATLYLFLEDQETAATYMARARELNPRIEYDNYWFLRPGDEKRLVGNARARLERHPDQPEYQASLAEALATTGDLAAAAEYYERALAATRSPDGKAVTGRNLYWAASYAWTLDQLGRRDEGETLMREVRAVLESLDDISYSGSALIVFELLDHSWRDDREALLATAERLADSGYIQVRFIESAPMLQRWAEEPRFAAAVTSLRERLAAQRETLRAQGL